MMDDPVKEALARLDRIGEAEGYLRSRTGRYEYRCFRYRAAIDAMRFMGLDNDCMVVDVGAGWTELDACLRTEYGWRGRYVPVDAMIDGTDLNEWMPPRRADFFVALEILEHLDDPMRLLVDGLMGAADRGVIVSVPNPEKTDVLGMDPTHRTIVTRQMLSGAGMSVVPRQFYGMPADSLLGTWANPTGLVKTAALRMATNIQPLEHDVKEVA